MEWVGTRARRGCCVMFLRLRIVVGGGIVIPKSTKNRILWEYMQYNEFRDQFNDYIVFSLAEIQKINPGFFRNRLNDWQKKGYIKKLRRGFDFDELARDVERFLFNPSDAKRIKMFISYIKSLEI